MNRGQLVLLVTLACACASYAVAQTASTQVRAIKKVEPNFPAEAKNVVYGDVVEVGVKINEEGKVVEAASSGPFLPCRDLKDKVAEAITKASLAAARETVFEPILKDGKPTDARVTITYKLPYDNPPAREKPNEKRKALFLAAPTYLQEAKNQNVQGDVQFLVVIDESGKVLSTRPLSGHPLLLAGAFRPSCEARFEKHTEKGIGILTYRFRKPY